MSDHPGAAKTLEAWTFLRTMLDNLTRAGAALGPDELRLVGTVYEGLLLG